MDNGMPRIDTAAHACVLCRRNKRRCDKSLPSCSLCSRMHRACEYTEPAAAADDLRTRVQELEELVARLTAQTPPQVVGPSLPTADSCPSNGSYVRSIFLDSEVLEFCNLPHAVTPNVQVPLEVSELLGGQSTIDEILRCYFRSIDTWMPIIHRAKLNRMIDGTQNGLRADLALLLLSMKLVQEIPPDEGLEQSSLYITTKRLHFALETANVCSVTKLQAALLIAVYEMGHALFPVAYASLGNCARQGVILGLHDSRAPQLLQEPRGWFDWEERLRVWWLIVILDRYITSGSDHRPLCTEDPGPGYYIPADETAWQRGDIVPPERVLQSSSTNIPVSPFARLAQASNMLGRVIRHCNDTTLSVQFVLEDIVSLSQATSSLLSLVVESDGTTWTHNAAAAICFSALLKLSDNHSCDSFDKCQSDPIEDAAVSQKCTELSLRMLRETACQIVSFVETLEQTWLIAGMDDLCPLLLHCIYRAALLMCWMAKQGGDGRYTAGKSICVALLQRANVRWKAAGAYLEVFGIMEREIEKDAF